METKLLAEHHDHACNNRSKSQHLHVYTSRAFQFICVWFHSLKLSIHYKLQIYNQQNINIPCTEEKKLLIFMSLYVSWYEGNATNIYLMSAWNSIYELLLICMLQVGSHNI